MENHLKFRGICRLYFAGLMVLTTLLCSGMNPQSQNAQSKAVRQSAMEAFSKGLYEPAYRQFNELLVTYPKDPLYKYYSGVCLVKLGRGPEEAASLLKQAQQDASVVRSIPADVLFWYGRALQLAGRFDEAISSFKDFAGKAGKKTARELQVQEYIQQCTAGRGSLPEKAIVSGTVSSGVKSEIKSGEKSSLKETVQKPVAENQKPVREKLPGSYDRALSEALDYQFKADSVFKIAEDLKKKLDRAGTQEKTAIRNQITEAEKLATGLQKQADLKYKEAQSLTPPVISGKQTAPDRSETLEQDSVKKINGKISPASDYSKDGKPANINKQQVITQKGSAKPVDNSSRKDSVNKREITKSGTPAVQKNLEVYSVFEVLQKPVSGMNEKIEINPKIPSGLLYRIQLGVFRNPVSLLYFKGITPVYGFRVAGTDRTNYYAGMFRRIADARKALLAVRQKGFKDAFVVALFSGKVISADRAAALEKEWAKKPFTIVAKGGAEVQKDTVPPTLSFRVEVIRSSKPVRDEVTEEIKKISGSRGYEIIKLDDGSIVYLIGKFITFESAEEYASLLVRNGYRDARVVAWLGKKEIPLETARQLFEKLK